MKKDIEQLIPSALEAVEKYLMRDGKVIGEYDGYAASLGPAVRTSGLIPAIAFYTDTSRTRGDARRFQLLKAIVYTLELGEPATEWDKDSRFYLEYLIDKIYENNPSEVVGSGRNERLKIKSGGLKLIDKQVATQKEKLINASIALKLAMRNFPHTKKQDQDES